MLVRLIFLNPLLGFAVCACSCAIAGHGKVLQTSLSKANEEGLRAVLAEV